MIGKIILGVPIVISIAFLILGIIVSEKSIKEFFGCVGLSIIVFVGCLFISIIIGFITTAIIIDNADTELVQVEEHNIYCLNDSSAISGTKFLFSGTINEKLKYRMFIEQNGGKILKEIDTEDVVVFEDGETKLVILKEKVTNENVIKWTGYEYVNSVTYQIHIPKGSITTEYIIDLNK